MAQHSNIVPIRDLQTIFLDPPEINDPLGEHGNPEAAEAFAWSLLFFAGLCGFIAGMLAVLIPALLLAAVL